MTLVTSGGAYKFMGCYMQGNMLNNHKITTVFKHILHWENMFYIGNYVDICS